MERRSDDSENEEDFESCRRPVILLAASCSDGRLLVLPDQLRVDEPLRAPLPRAAFFFEARLDEAFFFAAFLFRAALDRAALEAFFDAPFALARFFFAAGALDFALFDREPKYGFR